MPAAYAHLKFGRRVIEALPTGEIKETILCHQDIFEIGLQGPDILFFYHPISRPALNRLGHSLHEESPVAFLERPVCRSASGAAFAYLMGFICHYALDSEVHTAVEYYMDRTGRGHSEIETDLERVLMLKDELDPYRSGKLACICDTRNNAGIIAPFYSTGRREIRTALATMKFVDRLLTPSSDLKYTLLRRVGKWLGEGSIVSQLTMNRSSDPIFDMSNAELPLLMEQAVPVAIALLENFLCWQREESPLSQRFCRTFSYDPVELARRKERDHSV